MAQTRRKRRTKHRGTPAGTIETRGRTGRPPSAEERKKQTRVNAREERLNRPPTWKSSIARAFVAAAIVFIFILVVNHSKKNSVAGALLFTVIALLIYIPAGYYLETMMYRRRQRKKALGGGSGSGKAAGK
jgi:Flp pilus assembly protein TadB